MGRTAGAKRWVRRLDRRVARPRFDRSPSAMTPSDITTVCVALLGNPNTGKSTLFSALAGVRQRVGNYPGVTVEKKVGHLAHEGQQFTLIDLPGTYSLAPRSPDEMVAVDVLLGRRSDTPRPDVVLCIVDASNLQRNLYVVSQALELGLPTVVALNMMDVARACGITIDIEQLSKNLGIPVIAVQANRRRGIEELKAALVALRGRTIEDRASPFPEPFQREVALLCDRIGAKAAVSPSPGQSLSAGPAATNGHAPLPRYLVERLLLDTTGYLEYVIIGHDDPGLSSAIGDARTRLAAAGCQVPAIEAVSRYAWINDKLAGIVARPQQRPVTFSDRLDRVLTHRVWGTVIFALTMVVVFQAVFSWAAPAQDLIDMGVGYLARIRRRAHGRGGPAQPGRRWPDRRRRRRARLSTANLHPVFLHRAFGRLRLHGPRGLPDGQADGARRAERKIVHPAVVVVRLRDPRHHGHAHDRESTRSAHHDSDRPPDELQRGLPVYALLIAVFIPNRAFLGGLLSLKGLTLAAMYLIGIITATVMALLLKKTLLRGPTPPFVMELPSYKIPALSIVLHRMLERGWSFVRRAGTLIVAVAVVVWASLYYPHDAAVEAPYAEQRARLEAAARIDCRPKPPNGRKSRSNWPRSIIKIAGVYQQQSILGRIGHWIEPAVRPLGWDWRIGCAAIASFPAREVVVATLGIIYNLGDVDVDDPSAAGLDNALRQADLGRHGPEGVQRSRGSVVDGVFCAVRPVRGDLGRDQARDR